MSETTDLTTLAMRRFRTSILIVSLMVLGVSACAPATEPMDAEGLIRTMHDRYNGIRPGSMTFVQQTLLHRGGATVDTTTWYEAAVPGRLRIDFAPIDSGNGAIYDAGTLHVLRRGKVAISRPEVNPLLLMLMDVYQFEPSSIVTALDTLGFDLSVIRETEWEGRPVWVVGAPDRDEKSAQFWVEKERLITVRLIQPVGGGTSTLDARITGHSDADGYPQENEILMYVDGSLYQEEYYTQIRVGIDIDPAVFDTSYSALLKPYWE